MRCQRQGRELCRRLAHFPVRPCSLCPPPQHVPASAARAAGRWPAVLRAAGSRWLSSPGTRASANHCWSHTVRNGFGETCKRSCTVGTVETLAGWSYFISYISRNLKLDLVSKCFTFRSINVLLVETSFTETPSGLQIQLALNQS